MTIVKKMVSTMALFSGLLIVSAPAAAKCMQGPFKVDYPRQRLDERMQAIARRTGCAVRVDPKHLKHKQAPAVKGSVTTESLIRRSIRGSGLVASYRAGSWALASQRGEMSSGPLTIFYDPANARARQRIISYTDSKGLNVLYDLRRMHAIVVGAADGRSLREYVDGYEALPGVLSVQEDQKLELQDTP